MGFKIRNKHQDYFNQLSCLVSYWTTILSIFKTDQRRATQKAPQKVPVSTLIGWTRMSNLA